MLRTSCSSCRVSWCAPPNTSLEAAVHAATAPFLLPPSFHHTYFYFYISSQRAPSFCLITAIKSSMLRSNVDSKTNKQCLHDCDTYVHIWFSAWPVVYLISCDYYSLIWNFKYPFFFSCTVRLQHILNFPLIFPSLYVFCCCFSLPQGLLEPSVIPCFSLGGSPGNFLSLIS